MGKYDAGKGHLGLRSHGPNVAQGVHCCDARHQGGVVDQSAQVIGADDLKAATGLL